MKEQLTELAQLVKKMRDEQKAYFATRNAAHLTASKQLEKQVDQFVKDIIDPDAQLKLM